jgi:hypothetical protein
MLVVVGAHYAIAKLPCVVIFQSVKPLLGSIQWQNGQDFCPDTLYLESKRLRKLQQRTVKGRQRDRDLHA